MKSLESLMTQFRSKLVELPQLFDAAMPQQDNNAQSNIFVGKNDCLIVRVGKDYWACPLSPKECNFLGALLQNDGKMDRHDVGQWVKPLDDSAIRYFRKSICRKLAAKKMPVRLHYINWVISIEITVF